MTRATEALGLISSGVGRAVERLKERVGVRLLERTTRSLMFKDECRRFHEEVGPHLDDIEQAALLAAGWGLRVNVDQLLSRIDLPGQIAAFLERHSEVRVEMIMRDASGELVADGFDLALRFGEVSDKPLIARKVIDTRVLTVASPGFVERYGRPQHPS